MSANLNLISVILIMVGSILLSYYLSTRITHKLFPGLDFAGEALRSRTATRTQKIVLITTLVVIMILLTYLVVTLTQ